MKISKHVRPLLLSAIALLGAMTTSCSTETPAGPSSSNAGGGSQDLKQFVKSVTVKTQPKKTVYAPGEAIDLTGLSFDVVWSIQGEETEMPDMTYQDLDSYDKVAKEGMTAVNCTISEYTFQIAITVAPITDTYSSIEITRKDGTDNQSVLKDVDFFSAYKITAIAKEGFQNRELTDIGELNFKVKHDDKEEVVASNKVFSFPGDIEVIVEWCGLEGKLSVHVVNGYMVYGKDMIDTADIKDTDRNFLERDSDSKDMWVAWDAGVNYAGQILEGCHLIFHVWSDVARDANVILYASSTVRTYWAGYPDTENEWKPTETGDIKFDEVFTATYGKEKKTDIEIGDDVILPGCESKITNVEDCNNQLNFKIPDDKGRYYDEKIWVNWQMVNFGTIPLEVGDNVITLTCLKGKMANVYGLEAQFAD